MKKQILLIPGPVTTSLNVKDDMAHDYASREEKMLDVIKQIRNKILLISNLNENEYSTILFQGTGTYSNEAVLGTIPSDGKLVIFSNGVYGERLFTIAQILKIDCDILKIDYKEKITKNIVETYLNKNPQITHVGMVHNETTTGVLNPIEEIGPILKKRNIWFMIDAISSFGGIPIDIKKMDIDYVVGSSNKCLHSFPGISFVIAKKETLLKDKNNCKSLSLNLYKQWLDFDKHGQFRFTPPVQLLVALLTALDELIEYGGINTRHLYYKLLNKLIHKKFKEVGIKSYLSEENQGPIVSTFYFPENKTYEILCSNLAQKNITIYKSSVDYKKVFRIGNIGHITYEEMDDSINIMIKELIH